MLTTLPLPRKSQRTHLSTVNVHIARPIDSANFAQPMSHNSTYHSPTLVHSHNDSLATSTCIVSYIRRSILLTMSLYVNFIVSYDTYWVRSHSYFVSCNCDIAFVYTHCVKRV